MNAIRLRFPNRQQPDLMLGPGVHPIGRDIVDRPVVVDDPADAFVQFCMDSRGLWLRVREGVHGLHVNGRPVRRMALLRAGDAVFVDGHEWLLLGDTPPSAPVDANTPANETPADPRVVLRGVGGLHHGRCITLDRPRVVGRLPDCDVRINDAAFADRHARLDPHPEGAVLRDLGSHEGSVVNGWPVHNGLLRPGDQVVFDSHRFVVEAPRADAAPARQQEGQQLPEESESHPPTSDERKLPSSARRVPWLLLAALFLATSLSLLLLYGAR